MSAAYCFQAQRLLLIYTRILIYYTHTHACTHAVFTNYTHTHARIFTYTHTHAHTHASLLIYTHVFTYTWPGSGDTYF